MLLGGGSSCAIEVLLVTSAEFPIHLENVFHMLEAKIGLILLSVRAPRRF